MNCCFLQASPTTFPVLLQNFLFSPQKGIGFLHAVYNMNCHISNIEKEDGNEIY